MINLKEELKHLISFKSITSHQDNSRKLMQYIASRLEDLGLKHQEQNYNGFTSLIAGTKSLKECDILFQAHIDVVPGNDKLFKAEIVDDFIIGRGAYDMLFAVVCFLKVLEYFARNNQLSKLNIGLIFTSDEELGGFDGLPHILKNYQAKVCILPDAGGKDLLSVGSKGVLELELTIKGKGGHAARPSECINPIQLTANVIKQLEELFPIKGLDDTTCSLTRINAGDTLNRIPNTCSLFLNIRFNPDDNPKKIIKQIKSLFADSNVSVKKLVCEPAFSINTTHPFINLFIDSYKAITNRQVKTMLAPGSSDARFFPKNTPVIMIRPDGGGIHANNEHVSISSMEEFIQVILHYVNHFDTIRSSNE